MCWYTKNKPVKQEATSPITVYKILDNIGDKIISPLYIRYWTLDKLNQLGDKIEVTKLYNNIFGIAFGYHSSLTQPTCIVSRYLNYGASVWSNGKTSLMRHSRNRCVYMCEIPIGAHYYINENDEVVSDALIVRRKM